MICVPLPGVVIEQLDPHIATANSTTQLNPVKHLRYLLVELRKIPDTVVNGEQQPTKQEQEAPSEFEGQPNELGTVLANLRMAKGSH